MLFIGSLGREGIGLTGGVILAVRIECVPIYHENVMQVK